MNEQKQAKNEYRLCGNLRDTEGKLWLDGFSTIIHLKRNDKTAESKPDYGVFDSNWKKFGALWAGDNLRLSGNVYIENHKLGIIAHYNEKQESHRIYAREDELSLVEDALNSDVHTLAGEAF